MNDHNVHVFRTLKYAVVFIMINTITYLIKQVTVNSNSQGILYRNFNHDVMLRNYIFVIFQQNVYH